MISEQQQETASLYVLGAMPDAEKRAFETALRADPEMREFVRELEQTTGLLARAVPPMVPPAGLKDRILSRVQAGQAVPAAPAGSTGDASFFFVSAKDPGGWKALPVPGAFIKVLSVDRRRGYAVVLGRVEPGVRYPAHEHYTPEDFVLLSGDLTVAGRRLGPGDFHHADAGTAHPVNYSDEGCTLLAVLPIDNELAQFALSS